jgi:Tol biopolymer transport system component
MGSRRRSRRAFASSFFLFVPFGAGALAQSIVRIDVASDGSETTGQAFDVDVCDDGTKVVFSTSADGLDPADVNGFSDVLLRDLVAGTTTLVSVRTNGDFGNERSLHPRISADGRFVAFSSVASNLILRDQNHAGDVFLRDLAAGTTRRVSVATDGTEADGSSDLVAISGDGNRVLFSSGATNLVAGDTNGTLDLFLRDVAAKTTIRVSTAADGTEGDGPSWLGDLSRDGQSVAFISAATNLVPDDRNQYEDAFVHDLAAGIVERVSVRSDGSELAFGISWWFDGDFVAISADGRLATFATYQDDVAPGDVNNASDVFLRDRVAGTTTAVSVDSQGQFCASGQNSVGSIATAISADGRFVLFDSAAHLTSDDDPVGDELDVYVRDRALAMTTRQSNDPAGVSGDGSSKRSRMSADGSRIAFSSRATNLIEGHPTSGTCAFLRTRTLRPSASANYGAGYASTFGVPSLTIAALPLLNQPYDIAIENSSAQWTVALLLIGTQQDQIPTRLGGDLLVDPLWTQFLVLPPGGEQLTGTLPPDERLAAMSLQFQALQLDSGAVHGASFTPGLEIQAGF